MFVSVAKTKLRCYSIHSLFFFTNYLTEYLIKRFNNKKYKSIIKVIRRVFLFNHSSFSIEEMIVPKFGRKYTKVYIQILNFAVNFGKRFNSKRYIVTCCTETNISFARTYIQYRCFIWSVYVYQIVNFIYYMSNLSVSIYRRYL
eukprot:gnl/TRDRNA2_/TRDRNA2_177955_c0_seq3.p4 gnl/TRDRNA2_/TRDRNA2_177955_c0~~gnl/TRDRNA2_/TRDRNA2_177955_c0_seq3.p4  ORF type:complete len:144 (+),score=0.40 gnl/TRDRNA2_/TRDRNA2_177955_c0_seq3:2649-3080(+)